MNKFLILLFFALPVQADYFYWEIGAGINANFTSSVEWIDQNELGGSLGAGYVLETEDEIIDFNYRHYSHYFVGPPFDNRDESTLDSFYIFYRKKF